MSEPLVEIKDLDEAQRLIDQWIQAYRRLEVEHENLKHHAAHLLAAIRFDEIARQAEELEETACPF